jgi:hypothetical protein
VGRTALIFIFLLVGILYFLPGIVAHRNDHPYKEGILILNFFLGWSLIGWVAALVWAMSPRGQAIGERTAEQRAADAEQRAIKNAEFQARLAVDARAFAAEIRRAWALFVAATQSGFGCNLWIALSCAV